MTEPQRGQPGTWRYLAFWRGDGDMDLKATLAGLPCNDMHAAHLVAGEIWPGELHHATDLGRWHVWDGRCHRPDDCALIDRKINQLTWWCEAVIGQARQQVAAQVTAANPGADTKTVGQAIKTAWAPWGEAEKYAAGLRRTAGLTALRTRLAGVCGVNEAWLEDGLPDYLNVANGILHLPTLTLHPHDPRARITYCVPVAWNPQASCPWFNAMALRACDGSQVVADYLIRVLGYCLIGDNREQKIFFLSGDTGSGKSQVLGAIAEVLGTLHHSSQNSLISVERNGRNARVEWSCAGARIVTITETSGHNTTDEAQVKRLTGEAYISVDRHYSKTEVKVKVTFTIIQSTNEMQTLTNFDSAMGRRVEVLPMSKIEIPSEQQVKGLGKLVADREAEGILALLASAAQAYYAEGLHPPAEVLAETARYRAQQNTLEDFMAECVTIVPSLNGSRPAWAGQSAVWRAYLDHSAGGPRLRKSQFLGQLRDHPAVTYNEGSRRFEGISLIEGIEAHER